MNDTAKDSAGNLVYVGGNNSNVDFQRREVELIEDSDDDFPNFRENVNERIFVKSNITDKRDDGGYRVSYTETFGDEEIFIAGLKPVLVTLTKGVCAALNERKIVRASKAEIANYERKRKEKALAFISQQKQKHLESYIGLTGNSDGFESVWKNLESKEIAHALLTF